MWVTKYTFIIVVNCLTSADNNVIVMGLLPRRGLAPSTSPGFQSIKRRSAVRCIF